jgi:hypothetical protein
MQQISDATEIDGLISIAEAAKEVGVNRSTLTRQVSSGAIRSHGGKVRLSEVYADRASNIDSSRWVGRRRPRRSEVAPVVASKSPIVAPTYATMLHDDATLDHVHDDDCCACETETLLIDGKSMTIAAAKALRERYALQREQHLLDLASKAAGLRWQAIDTWRRAQVDTPGREEAVRRLVEIALSAS